MDKLRDRVHPHNIPSNTFSHAINDSVKSIDASDLRSNRDTGGGERNMDIQEVLVTSTVFKKMMHVREGTRIK